MRLLDLRDGQPLPGRSFWAPELMLPADVRHLEVMLTSLAPIDVVVTVPAEVSKAANGRPLRHALLELRGVLHVSEVLEPPDAGPWAVVVLNNAMSSAWVSGEVVGRNLQRARVLPR